MNSTLSTLIETCCELGATRALVGLGLTAGEISQRKARTVYGKWFTDAVKAGRLHPVAVEDGKAGTRKYSIAAILSLKAQDAAAAQLR